jgi:hypothetical protein
VSTIRIEWLSDSSSHCETCGTSYADGARVYVDDVLALDLAPVAHCFGGANYDQQEVFERLLKHLGHEVLL